MINYIKGDATSPINSNKKRAIIHIVNDKRAWGAGFVLAISRRWPFTRDEYRKANLKMGQIQVIELEPNLLLVNMCAQTIKDYYLGHDIPISYDALRDCLYQTKNYLQIEETKNCINITDTYEKIEIHAPKFGSGLSMGNWKVVEQLLLECYNDDRGIYIYEYGNN
jgi:hypothetical protein